MSSVTTSIILHGRDDEYVENFIEMLAFTINFLVMGICNQNLEKRIEIILVDWGSIKSFIPSIFDNLQAYQNIKVTGHFVDNETAKKLDGDSSYHVSKAVNFGIRKAKGDYVLVLSGNNIISELSLSQLLILLDNRERLLPHSEEIYGLLPRRNLPHPIAGSFSYQIIRNYFKNISLSRFPSNFKINSGGGACGLLFQKSLIERMNGISEESGMYGWNDAEIFYRIIEHTNAIDLGNYGISGFKFWRKNDSPNISKRRLEFDKVRQRYPNYLKPEFFQSNQNWGCKHIKNSVKYEYSSGLTENYISNKDPASPELNINKKTTFFDISFFQMTKIYFQYRKSQMIEKKESFCFHKMMQILDVILKVKSYQIIISRNSADKMLYFLLKILPGIECTIIDIEPGMGDAETNFGQLAKRVNPFYHSRLKYIRGREKVQDFFDHKYRRLMSNLQGLIILDPMTDRNIDFITKKSTKEFLSTKKIKIIEHTSNHKIDKTNDNNDVGRYSTYRYRLFFGIEILAYLLCSFLKLWIQLKKIVKYLITIR